MSDDETTLNSTNSSSDVQDPGNASDSDASSNASSGSEDLVLYNDMSYKAMVRKIGLLDDQTMPYITHEAAFLLYAFQNENYLELIEAVEKVAIEKLKRSQPDYVETVRYPSLVAKASMTKIIDDIRGENHTLALLASMHPKFIKYMILNTLGYRFQVDPSFKTYTYRTEAQRAGIYFNTIVRDDGTKGFLSGNEWRSVQEKIQNYVLMTKNDARAVAIDMVHVSVNVNSRKQSKQDAKDGDRKWMNQNGATTVFAAAIEGRYDYYKADKSVVQIQSPMDIGLAGDIGKRLLQKHRFSDLKGSSKPYALMLSVLKVLKIDVDVVQLPALYIWHEDQRAIGEILLTLLAGSLVEDGGYNATQPGVSLGGAKQSYAEEKHTVFVDKPWLKENLESIKTQLLEKGKHLDDLTKWLDFNVQVDKQVVNQLVDDVEMKQQKLYDQMDEVEAGLNQEIDVLEFATAQFESATASVQAEIDFQDAVSQWLFPNADDD